MWLCFGQAFLLAGEAADGSGRREAVSTALLTVTAEGVVIHLFATRKDRRRQGHGSRLFKMLEQHHHPKKVIVEANPPAVFWVGRKLSLIKVGPAVSSSRWFTKSGIYGRDGPADGPADAVAAIQEKNKDESKKAAKRNRQAAAAAAMVTHSVGSDHEEPDHEEEMITRSSNTATGKAVVGSGALQCSESPRYVSLGLRLFG